MTALTHGLLLVLVLSAMALAITINVAALAGWLRRHWRERAR